MSARDYTLMGSWAIHSQNGRKRTPKSSETRFNMRAAKRVENLGWKRFTVLEDSGERRVLLKGPA